MRQSNILLSVITALMVSGCSLHDINPDVQPQIQLQEGFASIDQDMLSNANLKAQLQTQWWEGLERPSLNALIEQSFAANNDIAAAVARINQARALQRQTRADLLPQINAQGNVADSWEGGSDQPSARAIGGALSWEVDVFNRIGAAARADELEAFARTEDLYALRLSLSAEVANAYFGAVAAHNRLKLLNDQYETDRDLLELIELRLESGVGTSVEVLQQRSQMSESRALIPPAEAELRVFENRLDVLLGQAPDAQDRVSADETLNFAAGLPALGVPADLLMNRPDLRAAKAELVAADADIAAAVAERLPQITLTGSYLYSDTSTYAGPLAAIMGAFVQPLLDWGKRKAAVEENKALYEERLASYTQAYLEAVEDVENALYQENKQREYLERLEDRRRILSDTVEESEALYKQGVDDYLPVLNALQDLRGVERSIVSEQLNLVNFRVELHRAIGGSTGVSFSEDENKDGED